MTCLVKICGITNIDDARAAIKEQADLLGFIFVDASPRSISSDQARALIKELPAGVKKVGVFQNEDLSKVKAVASDLQLDYVQLHGQESPEYCSQVGFPIIKVLELSGEQADCDTFVERCSTYATAAEIILVDRPKSATMAGAEWLKATVSFLQTVEARQPIIMAGGLNSDNIRFVIDALSPFGIDCASGVEASPGIKDHTKLKQFMTAIKGELVS